MTLQEVVANRQAGLHFNEPGTAMLSHRHMGAPIPDELHRFQISFSGLDSILNAIHRHHECAPMARLI
jgi:hypothetical protein